MASTNPVTATEILDEVVHHIDPSFAPEFARMVLRLRLSDTAQERIRGQLRCKNARTLDSAGRTALDNYVFVGQFVDLLHAKARVILQGGVSSA